MKRLIICADGTWDTPDIIDTDKKSAEQERSQSSTPGPEQEILYNKPIREPTNVVKMARAIKPTAKDNTPQVVGTTSPATEYTGSGSAAARSRYAVWQGCYIAAGY